MSEPLTRTAYTTRPMCPADVETAVELLMLNSASDIRPRLLDQLRPALSHSARHAFVAELDGVLVGAAKLAPEPAFPGTVSALLAVSEPARGAGIGHALADLLQDALKGARGNDTVTCTLRDDLEAGRAFAEGYGFAVTNHSVGWRYDLSGHGEELAVRAARTANVARVSVRRAGMNDEEPTIMECVSRCLEGAPMPFREDQAVDLNYAPRLIPDNAVIMLAESLAGSEPIICGLTIVTPQAAADAWYTIFTGVDPHYRRRGIAAAVKSAALLYAYWAGAGSVTTHNDDSNIPILRLNESLGMERTLGLWSLARPLDPA